MKYRRDLQIKLQQKYRLLYKTDAKLYSRQVGYLVAFIRDTPALAAIAAHVERSSPEIDAQAWAAENFGWHKADWPDSELGRAKVAWHLLRRRSCRDRARRCRGGAAGGRGCLSLVCLR